jgi:hypothetical protein
LAVGALGLSLGLLVAAIFIYDQLTMPEGFWTDGPRPGWLRRLNGVKERRREARWSSAAEESSAEQVDDRRPFAGLRLEGPTFTNMVRTHRFVFTPGVIAGFVGLALAAAVETWWLTLPFVGGVLVATIWYLINRPATGVD